MNPINRLKSLQEKSWKLSSFHRCKILFAGALSVIVATQLEI